MPLADYSHWNEEATMVWWEEEGKHGDNQSEPDIDEDWDTNWDYDEWDGKDGDADASEARTEKEDHCGM